MSDPRSSYCSHCGYSPTCSGACLKPKSAVPQPTLAQPIDMVLFCPACGKQHIDAPKACTVHDCHFYSACYAEANGQPDQCNRWTNPPHRSHLCHGCGHIWRPADVPTNGVAAIKTKGKNDAPPGGCAAPTPPAEPVETVPWPTVTRYSGGASHEGIGGRVWVRLADDGPEVEYAPTMPARFEAEHE